MSASECVLKRACVRECARTFCAGVRASVSIFGGHRAREGETEGQGAST